MIKRLQIKFICITMTIVTAMLCVIFSLIIFFMGMGMEIRSENRIQEISGELMRPGGHELPNRDLWAPYFAVRFHNTGEIAVVDSSYFEGVDDQVLLQYAQEALAQEQESGLLEEYALRYMHRHTPNGKILVFLDISSEVATMDNLVISCVVIGILSFWIFLGISVLLARWAVKPVETAWNQQRQFVADASHELKTPLTVIMTNAELLQSPEYTEGDRRRFSDSILTMAYQMRGLVESLLELARVDNGTAKMVFSELNFSELISDSLLPFEPVYFEKNLALESKVEEDLRVRGSSGHLQQVLDILLDNAAKYTAAGGTVVVKLQRNGGSCLLSVSNPGATISKDELKNIFKRFYRIDKARAMNHSYGLGLPIAQSIVQEHGGRIWAESDGGINTFCVQLNAL